MEKGLYDKAADEIVRRYGLVRNEIIRRNKGKKPFRMEKVPDEERITDYYDFLDNPDVEQQWRMEAGDEPVDKYHQDLRTLINRRMMQNA